MAAELHKRPVLYSVKTNWLPNKLITRFQTLRRREEEKLSIKIWGGVIKAQNGRPLLQRCFESIWTEQLAVKPLVSVIYFPWLSIYSASLVVSVKFAWHTGGAIAVTWSVVVDLHRKTSSRQQSGKPWSQVSLGAIDLKCWMSYGMIYVCCHSGFCRLNVSSEWLRIWLFHLQLGSVWCVNAVSFIFLNEIFLIRFHLEYSWLTSFILYWSSYSSCPVNNWTTSLSPSPFGLMGCWLIACLGSRNNLVN